MHSRCVLIFMYGDHQSCCNIDQPTIYQTLHDYWGGVEGAADVGSVRGTGGIEGSGSVQIVSDAATLWGQSRTV